MITDETRKKWKDKIETIFEAAEYSQIELNEWETEFFDSVYQRVIYENKDLSMKQSISLNKIYEKIK